MQKYKKILIRVHPEDLDTLKKFFPERGYNAVARVVLNKFCRVLRQKEAEHVRTAPIVPTIDSSDFDNLEAGGPG